MTQHEAHRLLAENGFTHNPQLDIAARAGFGIGYRAYSHSCGASVAVPLDNGHDSSLEYWVHKAINKAQQHAMTVTLDQCS